ncbi:HopJ type III effector protein [Aestuariirhabdus sp. LZHN29]|uniref:HopJ type III effector protein n=1 Tax=Aestuariirhabdus sp. LZHN29 TaxID=3417462 RepID=UPI003CF5A4EF
MSNLKQLLDTLGSAPETISFDQVQAVIAAHYDYRPTTFTNGAGDDPVTNRAGSNEGSCRVFAFALLHQLDPQQTLACFGDFYRQDVLGNPAGEDHANIRRFMRDGWSGIRFDGVALTKKQPA